MPYDWYMLKVVSIYLKLCYSKIVNKKLTTSLTQFFFHNKMYLVPASGNSSGSYSFLIWKSDLIDIIVPVSVATVMARHLFSTVFCYLLLL